MQTDEMTAADPGGSKILADAVIVSKSPCLTCSNKDGDKTKCAETCERLKAYQEGRIDMLRASRARVKGKKIDTNGRRGQDASNAGGEVPGPSPSQENTPAELPLCCCGCGRPVARRGNKYLNGHAPSHMSGLQNKGTACVVPGCETEAHSRGLCGRHYRAWYRGRLEGFEPFNTDGGYARRIEERDQTNGGQARDAGGEVPGPTSPKNSTDLADSIEQVACRTLGDDNSILIDKSLCPRVWEEAMHVSRNYHLPLQIVMIVLAAEGLYFRRGRRASNLGG